jgi:hypothetical protein
VRFGDYFLRVFEGDTELTNVYEMVLTPHGDALLLEHVPGNGGQPARCDRCVVEPAVAYRQAQNVRVEGFREAPPGGGEVLE